MCVSVSIQKNREILCDEEIQDIGRTHNDFEKKFFGFEATPTSFDYQI
jgi:hypothetical protein